MAAEIRPAVPEDIDAIASFTRDTFEWGDYVTTAFPTWLADDSANVMVADDGDRVVAVAACTLLSPTEAWVQGARVHPDARRRGLGSQLNRALTVWAKDHGARVARLAIEDWNRPAIKQTDALGYRAVCDWVYASRAVGAASPVPEGNGGRRVPTAEKLRQAPSGEADPAFLSWTTGAIAKAARGLFAARWQWRRMRVDDLEEAGQRGDLWEGRAGWAIASAADETLEVAWLETSPDDAYALGRALVDLAVDRKVDSIEFMVPQLDWLVAALRRAGCETTPLTVYSLPLG